MPLVSSIYSWGKNRSWNDPSKPRKKKKKAALRAGLRPTKAKRPKQVQWAGAGKDQSIVQACGRLLRVPIAMAQRWEGNEYKLYLNSNEWVILKNGIIKDRGYKCEKCGSRKSIDLHHLTYDRLGNEYPEDLELVCRTCHKGLHRNN